MTQPAPSDLLQKKFLDPRAPARLGLLVIAVFVLVMLGWGAVAPLSSAVVASGVLQAEGGRQSVQHPYGGVIAEILVGEGERVQAGQLLVRLSDAEPRAQVDVLLAERDSLLAEQGRLIAERDGADDIAFTDALLARADETSAAQAMASERQLMQARMQQALTQNDVLEQQKSQLAETIAAAEAQVASIDTQRQSVATELEDARTLLADQLVERTRVTTLERTLAEQDAQIAVRRAEAASAAKAIAEIDFEIAGLDRDRLTEVTAALRQNQSALAALAPRLAAAQDALNRTDIIAPAAGTVVGLDVVTRGGVVAAGAELMAIVPADNPLIVEGQMPLADITDVTAGTRADIRLLAVPATARPPLSGTVQTVSADRVVDERSGRSFYALRVALDADDVAAAGITLQAGMPVQVIVPTNGRTMIDYLISPLLDEIGGAFRER